MVIRERRRSIKSLICGGESFKSQPELAQYPKNDILKKLADVDFSQLVIVAIDPRARATNIFLFILVILVGDPLFVSFVNISIIMPYVIIINFTFKDEMELRTKLTRSL